MENTTRVWIKYKLQGNGSDSWECQVLDLNDNEITRYMEFDSEIVLSDINKLEDPEKTSELTRLKLI